MSRVSDIRAVAFDACKTLFQLHSIITECDELFVEKSGQSDRLREQSDSSIRGCRLRCERYAVSFPAVLEIFG